LDHKHQFGQSIETALGMNELPDFFTTGIYSYAKKMLTLELEHFQRLSLSSSKTSPRPPPKGLLEVIRKGLARLVRATPAASAAL
jgi:hypothetical protein